MLTGTLQWQRSTSNASWHAREPWILQAEEAFGIEQPLSTISTDAYAIRSDGEIRALTRCGRAQKLAGACAAAQTAPRETRTCKRGVCVQSQRDVTERVCVGASVVAARHGHPDGGMRYSSAIGATWACI